MKRKIINTIMPAPIPINAFFSAESFIIPIEINIIPGRAGRKSNRLTGVKL